MSASSASQSSSEQVAIEIAGLKPAPDAKAASNKEAALFKRNKSACKSFAALMNLLERCRSTSVLKGTVLQGFPGFGLKPKMRLLLRTLTLSIRMLSLLPSRGKGAGAVAQPLKKKAKGFES